MSLTIILDYSEISMCLHRRLMRMVELKMVPDLNYNQSFCDEITLANIKDAIEFNLNHLIGVGSVSNLENSIESHCMAAAAAGDLEKILFSKNNLFQNTIVNKDICLPILKLFAKGDISGIYSYLSRADYMYGRWAVSCIEQTWPYGTAHLPDKESECSKKYELDSVVVAIMDLGLLQRHREFVESQIEGNPYSLWTLSKMSNGTITMHCDGDYRINEWHAQKNKDENHAT